MYKKQLIDILILSNGPGEISTWVRPVVKALRQDLGNKNNLRISTILSPCPHSTGRETKLLNSYVEINRVQSAEHFLNFLLWGKTANNWDWSPRGIVIFLGGDQFFPLIIGKRLGYKTLIYAEWDARWYRWIDRFAIRKPEIIAKVPPQYHHKFTIVGDLIADLAQNLKEVITVSERKTANQSAHLSVSPSPSQPSLTGELIAFLPGSKPAKLSQGVPLCLAIAQQLKALRPEVQFIIPVAPTLELSTLGKFARSQTNPILQKIGGVEGTITKIDNKAYLVTESGIRIELITEFPAYEYLSQCQLCITTVGANTAELGSLCVPAIVLLPTQQLDAMRAWDGLPGILANLPAIGSSWAKLINWFVLRQKRLFAWPNIWAQREIVPELVGELKAKDIAELVLDYLQHPDKLDAMRNELRSVRGESGAATKMVEIVAELLADNY